MTVDETIQLLRTTSLPRLREHLEDVFRHDQIFYEKLVNILLSSQKPKAPVLSPSADITAQEENE